MKRLSKEKIYRVIGDWPDDEICLLDANKDLVWLLTAGNGMLAFVKAWGSNGPWLVVAALEKLTKATFYHTGELNDLAIDEQERLAESKSDRKKGIRRKSRSQKESSGSRC
jgi:hypothetical protein